MKPAVGGWDRVRQLNKDMAEGEGKGDGEFCLR